jgi:hypothetical protein
MVDRWMPSTRVTYAEKRKRVYYLSLEFLIGRLLMDSLSNLGLTDIMRSALSELGVDLDRLRQIEPDAALGNGGLGRLAACFLDSLATLQYPAIGYGLRYEYGIFRQSIQDGWQSERPDDWLRNVDPWEVRRPHRTYAVPLNGTFELRGAGISIQRNRPSSLLGVAYDRPVVGYGGHCINTLRLWAAAAPNSLDFAEFSHGDFAGAVLQNVAAESVTRGADAALPAAILPGELLDTGHRRALPRGRRGLADAAGARRHPDERHTPGAVRCGAHAGAARRRAAAVGGGLGSDRALPRVYQPHAAARGAGALARRDVRDIDSTPPADHLRDQPALSR